MQISISNDRLTVLKIIAVIAMVIDHYNKFVNPEYSQVMFSVGRIALPIFVFVLAYNLARIPTEKMPPILARLVFFGLLAVYPYVAMGGAILGGWWPLNVLFLLAGQVAMAYLSKRLSGWSRWAAVLAVFAGVGAVAEFFWFGLALGHGLFLLFSLGENSAFQKLIKAAFPALMAVPGLAMINGNLWLFMAVPVIAAVLWLPWPKLPRGKWFFYWFYPAHLWALWGIF